tara:strand:+ start:1459 stop:1797 length:339 start_codon:yes stop_codon:yes gene_type:complete
MKEYDMSLPSQAQGDLEDRIEKTYNILATFIKDTEVREATSIDEYLIDCIEGAMNESGLTDRYGIETDYFWKDAITIMFYNHFERVMEMLSSKLEETQPIDLRHIMTSKEIH